MYTYCVSKYHHSFTILYYTPFQSPGSPVPSESPGPDSTVTTPTDQAAASPAEAFAQAALPKKQDDAAKELEPQTNDSEIRQEDPSIHVDANNKEMKTVLEKTSSTEVISALTLDSRLKSDSVASLGSARSDSYGSVASNISNGIFEKAGSYTSVVGAHGLVRYRSVSGRPLSDIVSTW